MKYKPDWDDARERLIALWEGRFIDRPCIALTVPAKKQREIPRAQSLEENWLDGDFIVRSLLAEFESTWYGGEFIPSRLVMAGWVATLYGAKVRYAPDTIWFDPMAIDWENPPSFDLDMRTDLFRAVEKVHAALLAAAGRDDFLVGQACLMPPADLLSVVTGADRFLVSLMDHPDAVKAALRKMTRNWIAVHQHLFAMARRTHAFWYGNAGWMPIWGPKPFLATQSDVSCMLSPDQFEEFVVPELEAAAQVFGTLWYHLDGQTALQHLPRLLSIPSLDVIQFTTTAGTPPNGPAYLDLYRKIQAAGKIVHIRLPAKNLEPLVRELDPSQIFYWVDGCANIRDAEDLLKNAARWVHTSERSSS